jgi:2-C-methyl-D-erythritol 2,4-cyclodiphosphate synthase
MKFRVGNGFDFHPLRPGRKLILGGIEIPHNVGLQGHSDADVLAHALSNAILGALGEGDLGSHFPDSDPRYASADSIGLLTEAWAMATGRGWRLENADITVFAERPKLKPHIGTMRNRIAAALGASLDRINIKATSPEGLGALGRSEGMAAAAIVMLAAD